MGPMLPRQALRQLERGPPEQQSALPQTVTELEGIRAFITLCIISSFVNIDKLLLIVYRLLKIESGHEVNEAKIYRAIRSLKHQFCVQRLPFLPQLRVQCAVFVIVLLLYTASVSISGATNGSSDHINQ
jgi:hypothetical protein